MKRVLVTGAKGFLGRHALPLLLAGDYEVHAVSSKQSEHRDSDAHEHMADLLDDDQLQELIAKVKPTHLLHLAWYTEPGKYWTATENLDWLCASIRLLRAFAEHGGKRVLVAGTCAEYEWNDTVCREGTSALKPATLYGACKHALQLVLESYVARVGLSYAWGRVFFPFGPNERPERFVPSVIRALLANEPARCTHGNQQRDFLYIEDVAEAFVGLLGSEVRGPVNVASGQAVSLREIAYRIGEMLNRSDLIQLGAIPAAPGEPSLLVADVSRLQDELGWRPGIDLNTGLARTIEWWRRFETSA